MHNTCTHTLSTCTQFASFFGLISVKKTFFPFFFDLSFLKTKQNTSMWYISYDMCMCVMNLGVSGWGWGLNSTGACILKRNA